MHYRPLHNTSVGRGSDYSVKAAVISIFILTADQTSTCVVKGITRCSSLQLFDVFQLIVLVFRAKAISSWLTFTALFQLFLTVCQNGKKNGTKTQQVFFDVKYKPDQCALMLHPVLFTLKTVEKRLIRQIAANNLQNQTYCDGNL